MFLIWVTRLHMCSRKSTSLLSSVFMVEIAHLALDEPWPRDDSRSVSHRSTRSAITYLCWRYFPGTNVDHASRDSLPPVLSQQRSYRRESMRARLYARHCFWRPESPIRSLPSFPRRSRCKSSRAALQRVRQPLAAIFEKSNNSTGDDLFSSLSHSRRTRSIWYVFFESVSFPSAAKLILWR